MEKFEKALKEAFAATFAQSEEAMARLKDYYEKSDKSQSLENFAWWTPQHGIGDTDYNLCCRFFENLMEKSGYKRVTNYELHNNAGLRNCMRSYRDYRPRMQYKSMHISGFYRKYPSVKESGDFIKTFYVVFFSPRESYEDAKRSIRKYNKWKKRNIKNPVHGVRYSVTGEE